MLFSSQPRGSRRASPGQLFSLPGRTDHTDFPILRLEGAIIALAATPADLVTLTAALSTGIPLQAAAADLVTLTAAATTGIKLVAAPADLVTLTAALSTGIPLQAAAADLVTLTAAATTGIKLAATPADVVTLTATLAAGGSAVLAASVADVTSVTASLSTGIQLAAAPVTLCTLTADLTGGAAQSAKGDGGGAPGRYYGRPKTVAPRAPPKVNRVLEREWTTGAIESAQSSGESQGVGEVSPAPILAAVVSTSAATTGSIGAVDNRKPLNEQRARLLAALLEDA